MAQPITQTEFEHVMTYLNSGMSVRAASNTTGISPATIYRIRKARTWRKFHANGRKLAVEQVATNPTKEQEDALKMLSKAIEAFNIEQKRTNRLLDSIESSITNIAAKTRKTTVTSKRWFRADE